MKICVSVCPLFGRAALLIGIWMFISEGYLIFLLKNNDHLWRIHKLSSSAVYLPLNIREWIAANVTFLFNYFNSILGGISEYVSFKFLVY